MLLAFTLWKEALPPLEWLRVDIILSVVCGDCSIRVFHCFIRMNSSKVHAVALLFIPILVCSKKNLNQNAHEQKKRALNAKQCWLRTCGCDKANHCFPYLPNFCILYLASAHNSNCLRKIVYKASLWLLWTHGVHTYSYVGKNNWYFMHMYLPYVQA